MKTTWTNISSRKKNRRRMDRECATAPISIFAHVIAYLVLVAGFFGLGALGYLIFRLIQMVLL